MVAFLQRVVSIIVAGPRDMWHDRHNDCIKRKTHTGHFLSGGCNIDSILSRHVRGLSIAVWGGNENEKTGSPVTGMLLAEKEHDGSG